MGYFRTNRDIKALYEKARKLTGNFTKIQTKILHKHPEVLTVIRLGLGQPQRNFAMHLGITRASLAHYELGNKHMKYEREVSVCDSINKILANNAIPKETVFKNYQHLWGLAMRGQNPDAIRELGRKAVSHFKATQQETKIEEILKKHGREFQRGAIVYLDSMGFSFDFVMPNANAPKMIVECKIINAKSKKNCRIRSYAVSYEIAYKFRLIKMRDSSIKRVLILDALHDLPDRSLLILKKETDFLLINPNENKILECLKNI